MAFPTTALCKQDVAVDERPLELWVQVPQASKPPLPPDIFRCCGTNHLGTKVTTDLKAFYSISSFNHPLWVTPKLPSVKLSVSQPLDIGDTYSSKVLLSHRLEQNLRPVARGTRPPTMLHLAIGRACRVQVQTLFPVFPQEEYIYITIITIIRLKTRNKNKKKKKNKNEK